MNKINQNDLILLLNNHQDIGAQTIKKILKICDDREPEFILKGSKEDLSQKVGEKISELVCQARQQDIEAIKQELSSYDIGYVTLLDNVYPRLLAEIPDCPAVLYIKGNYDIINKPSLAIVGSRKYTDYGARAARKITADLAPAGIIIVSGLALGIDAVAHQTALYSNVGTIGVLGCGLDMIYPLSNSNLAKKIVDSGGMIISEYPPHTRPFKSNFPARNRIIAGLTLGTIVIEAAVESGALITALAALEYNREVFAVPGPIDSESSEGCNRLIQQGAKLINSGNDVLEELNISLKKSQIKAKQAIAETPEQRTIIELILPSGLAADDIIRQSKMNVAQVSQILTILEMKGILENVGGLWKKKM